MSTPVYRSDIKRSFSETINFNSLLREHQVFLSSFDNYDLKDVFFKFYAAPSLEPLLPSQGLFGVRDLRLYINGEEYTPYLKLELVDLLKSQPATTVKKQYLEGGTKWLQYLEMYRDALKIDVEKDKRLLEKLVNELDLTTHFSHLGHKDYGFGGNLHLINYLYRSVQLEPISLLNVYNRRLIAQGSTPLDLLNLEKINILISQGPAPSYGTFSPADFHPLGRLYLMLESIYKNPLDEPIKMILDQVNTTLQTIDNHRTQFLEPIRKDVDLLEINTEKRFKDYERVIEGLAKTIKEKLA